MDKHVHNRNVYYSEAAKKENNKKHAAYCMKHIRYVQSYLAPLSYFL